MDINSVNVFYDIEYNSYKKKLMRDIFIQVDTIFNIFDKNFNDNMIKLFIIFKKNKIKNDNAKYLVLSLYDFIVELNNLEHIDQNEFLNLILKLIKIYIILQTTNSDIKKGIIDDEIIQFINWEIINNKIITCINDMKKNNKIISIMIELSNQDFDEQNDNENIKNTIKNVAGLLAYDFFMYYTSTEIHKTLYKKVSVNSDVSSKLNKLGIIIIKYKKYFIKEYREKYHLYVELYDEVIKSNISKYKVEEKNSVFEDLVTELIAINSKLNK
jgi:hypothetical protein